MRSTAKPAGEKKNLRSSDDAEKAREGIRGGQEQSIRGNGGTQWGRVRLPKPVIRMQIATHLTFINICLGKEETGLGNTSRASRWKKYNALNRIRIKIKLTFMSDS